MEGTKGKRQHVIFVNTAGEEIVSALYPQFDNSEPETGESLNIELEHAALGLDIDAETAITLWEGETMDYGLAVGGLFEIAERSGSSGLPNR